MRSSVVSLKHSRTWTCTSSIASPWRNFSTTVRNWIYLLHQFKIGLWRENGLMPIENRWLVGDPPYRTFVCKQQDQGYLILNVTSVEGLKNIYGNYPIRGDFADDCSFIHLRHFSSYNLLLTCMSFATLIHARARTYTQKNWLVFLA